MNRRHARPHHRHTSDPRILPGLEPAQRPGRRGGTDAVPGPDRTDALARLLPEASHLFFPFR